MSFRTAALASDTSLPEESKMTFTDNGALTFKSSGDALLSFFQKAMARDRKSATPDEEIERLFAAAYEENPIYALRLWAHRRDCRKEGVGAGERHVTDVVTRWLAQHHPEQVQANLQNMPFYGRWDDLYKFTVGTDLEKPAMDLVADQLHAERQVLTLAEKATDETERRQLLASISNCAKWAPNEKSATDKMAHRLARSSGRPVTVPSHYIANKLRSLAGKDSRVHSTVMRNYRTMYLKPLREATNVVEQALCAKRWDDVDFTKVPSKAMMIYGKKCFPTHMKERFEKYQKDVSEGKAKMATGQVDPYEIVSMMLRRCGDWSTDLTTDTSKLTLAQNFYDKQIVELAAQLGDDVTSTIVMADVSGSMNAGSGAPLRVSISMAIWMASLARGPWKDLTMTFHSKPQFIDLSRKTLAQKLEAVVAPGYCGSTNLQAAFDLILEKGMLHRLKNEDMPKRIIIVSDMQFNGGCSNLYTNHEEIKAKYRLHGYDMPEVVYWNVNGTSTGSPVEKDEMGVALASGFSKNMIKAYMTNTPIPTPLESMFEVLDNEFYDRVVWVAPDGETYPTSAEGRKAFADHRESARRSETLVEARRKVDELRASLATAEEEATAAEVGDM